MGCGRCDGSCGRIASSDRWVSSKKVVWGEIAAPLPYQLLYFLSVLGIERFRQNFGWRSRSASLFGRGPCSFALGRDNTTTLNLPNATQPSRGYLTVSTYQKSNFEPSGQLSNPYANGCGLINQRYNGCNARGGSSPYRGLRTKKG